MNPAVIKWARERCGFNLDEAAKKFSKKYKEWEEGTAQPTTKQLQKIAKTFYVPFGYFFLTELPEDKLPAPIVDFRISKEETARRPSADLLDTIYNVQRKQQWLREEKFNNEEPPLIREKHRTDADIIEEINTVLNITEMRKQASGYEAFLESLIQQLDKQEYLIIRNGVVGNNTHRPLKKEEFKGFALADEYAPLIFINAVDYKASQIFTLVHELAHVFLFESGLDGNYHRHTEARCNKIAASVLLPHSLLKRDFDVNAIEKIAKKYKTSVFVVLIQAKQSNLIEQERFNEQWEMYEREYQDRNNVSARGATGGNYYNNVPFRAGGEQFLLRVFHSTVAGNTLYTDAYDLTGLRGETFRKYYEGRGFHRNT